MKALSVRQPWVDAILYGGKRIENRDWKNSNFRGEFLIHASKGMTREEYADVVDFMTARKELAWRPKPIDQLVRGAIVGRAKVVGIVRPTTSSARLTDDTRGVSRALTDNEDSWWMGGFALALDDVVAFEKPIPFLGSLGFFGTPFDREGRRVP